MNALELAQLYQGVVQDDLGLPATIDEVNDVVFKHPDLGTLFFSLDAEHDPEYLMLVFPNFADRKTTGKTEAELLALVNRMNCDAKAVKFTVRDGDVGNVSATIEAFVGGRDEPPTREQLVKTVGRSLQVLAGAARALLQKAAGNAAS